MHISLKDNQFNGTPWKDAWGGCDPELKNALNDISGKSIKDLASEENENIFFFRPGGNTKNELDNKNNFIFKCDSKDKPSFKTGNIMGFFDIAYGENKSKRTQVQITSRFDDSEDNLFLQHMLRKVLDISDTNLAFAPRTNSSENSFFDFLYYLFPNYLKKACVQGIYRAYVTREYNDANVRGPIDVARHIRYNIPFNGKIAYHTREYTTDNKITQLVRHTIEYIRSLSHASFILSSDNDTREYVDEICGATPTYSRNSRIQVIAQNLRPVTHPYYTAYEDLRRLCLMILRHDKFGYGKSDDQLIQGVLFDGASLWEEYLAKVIEEQCRSESQDTFELRGYKHSNNRKGEKGIRLFKNSRTKYYPDFYRLNSAENMEDGFVLDAKYKRLCTIGSEKAAVPDDEASDEDVSEPESKDEKDGVHFHYKRDDLFQMLAYMHALEIRQSYLISPYQDEKAEEKLIISPNPREAEGFGGKIFIVAVPIPCCKGENEEIRQKEFERKMVDIESELVKQISDMLKKKKD